MSDMVPKGWLFVRDGNLDFSLSGKWDSQADEFMSKIISDFKPMHEGSCCNWNANDMQQSIESLHIYPHLLIAKRTDGKARLVKAPGHGTSWIPYMIEMDAKEKAGSPSIRIRRRGHRRHRHLLEEGFDDEGKIASEKDAKEKADSLSADEDDVQEVHGDEDMNTSKADMNTSKADSLSADEDDVQEVHGDEDMITHKVIEKWIQHKREWIENKTNVEWLRQYGVMYQMRNVLSSEGNGGVESGSKARQPYGPADMSLEAP